MTETRCDSGFNPMLFGCYVSSDLSGRMRFYAKFVFLCVPDGLTFFDPLRARRVNFFFIPRQLRNFGWTNVYTQGYSVGFVAG